MTYNHWVIVIIITILVATVIVGFIPHNCNQGQDLVIRLNMQGDKPVLGCGSQGLTEMSEAEALDTVNRIQLMHVSGKASTRSALRKLLENRQSG